MAIQTVAKGATSLGGPIDADDIHLLGGSATIDQSNLDWSGVAAADNVIVPPTFNGALGTAAVPFQARVTTLFEYAASGGSCHWSSDSDGTPDDTSARLLMPLGTAGHMHLVAASASIVTLVETYGGQLTIPAGVASPSLYMGAGAVVRQYDVGTDSTTIRNAGGTLYLWRGASVLNHDYGQTIIQSDNSNVITTLNIHTAGVQIMSTGGAAITNCLCYGGIPDTSQLNQAFICTNTTINISLPGARDFENHPLITHSSITYIGGR